MKPTSIIHIFIFIVYLMKEPVISSNESREFKMEEHWFEEYLDHFNVWDNRTFPLRYFEYNKFFKNGGPLLLELGAETTADPEGIKNSPSYTLAKKLNGTIVLLEHRYYGESSPFDNPSVQEFSYLTVEQVLEDIAYFVEDYKNTTTGLKSSKVAVFGCSYAGALATWFRYKFPHLVDAAWASSGPLRVVSDFYEYYEVAGEMYSNVSSECIAIIRQGYREAIKMLSTPEGEKEVRALFQDWECGNTTELDAKDILGVMRMVVANQYTYPSYNIDSCKFLQSKNSSTTCFQQLAALILSNAKDVCEDDSDNDTPWDYQRCTAFGYCFTTSSHNQPFKDTHSAIDSFLVSCKEDFREDYNTGIHQRSISRMNRVYGATDLKVTKVITVHGMLDPWHKMGLYRQPNKNSPVFLISGSSHCADLSRKPEKPELPELTVAREKAMEIMSRWLQ